MGRGTLGQESLGGLVSSANNAVGKRELEFVAVELSGGLTDAVLGSELLDVDNLDGGQAGAVASSHVLIQLSHSSGTAGVAVLLVHVVSGGS